MRSGRRTVIWAVTLLVMAGVIHSATADQTYTFSGSFGTKAPKWVQYPFGVSHASLLRITLDRTDPTVEIAVTLEDPSGATVASTRASALDIAPLEFNADTAGTWSVLLRAKRGSVQYDLHIEVLDPNRAPVARDDQASTTSPDKVVVDVLGNDSDPDGNALQVASAGAPNHGTASLTDTGSVAYVPDAGFTGSDSFSYKVCDDGVPSLCAPATVSIDVQAPAVTPPPPSPSLAPAVTGLSTRGGPSPGVGASIPRAYWSDVQPTAFGPIVHPNAIDAAIARGTPFRIRITAGRYAPQWVMDLGSVTITDPFQGTNATYVVPRWWTSAYVNAYTDLITKLAAAYDGRVPAFTMSGPTTVCAEPFLHQLGSSATRSALLAAGWSTAAERDAFEKMIDAHALMKSSRTVMAINPGQTYDPATGAWDTGDIAYMKTITDYFVAKLGQRAIVQNNSLNVTRATQQPAYEAMYSYMKQLRSTGVAISFQTAQTSLVEDLPWVLDYAVNAGAYLVELPADWSTLDTATHLATVDKELKANGP